jgi:hypothetical protein
MDSRNDNSSVVALEHLSDTLINVIFENDYNTYYSIDVNENSCSGRFTGACVITKNEMIKIYNQYGNFESFINTTNFKFEFMVGVSEHLNTYFDEGAYSLEFLDIVKNKINDIKYLLNQSTFTFKIQDLSDHGLNYGALYVYVDFNFEV